MNTAAANRRFVMRLVAFRWLLARRIDLSAEGDGGVFFIGRGDWLDDDRRLVRAEALRRGPAKGPGSRDASRFG